jgi:hypothetical protein
MNMSPRPSKGLERRAFANEEEEVDYYRGFLRDGAREEKIAAREELAHLFERRGRLDMAAGLYEANVRAGDCSRATYERLAALHRQRGDALSEARVLSRMNLDCQPAPVSSPRVRPVRPSLLAFLFIVSVTLGTLAGAATFSASVAMGLNRATGEPSSALARVPGTAGALSPPAPMVAPGALPALAQSCYEPASGLPERGDGEDAARGAVDESSRPMGRDPLGAGPPLDRAH